MMNRQALLDSIAHTIADYRLGEIPQPDAEHVQRWVEQFKPTVQQDLLAELNYVLQKTYLSQKRVKHVLQRWVIDPPQQQYLNPCDFWQNAVFINHQLGGNSQKVLLDLFYQELIKHCHLPLKLKANQPQHYIYVDDGLFSGSRIQRDIEAWLPQAQPNTSLIVLVIAAHSSGLHYTAKRLQALCQPKQIHCEIQTRFVLENMTTCSEQSEVLWPATLPNDTMLHQYVQSESRYPFKVRSLVNPPSQSRVFSTPVARQLLEQELLLAGLKIRNACKNPAAIMRPLGYSAFGLGFGSMVVTYRNCPNNAPLALWWGEPDNPDLPDHHRFKQWYPLLPRKTYSQNQRATADVDFEWDE